MTRPSTLAIETFSDVFSDVFRLYAKARFSLWNAPKADDEDSARAFLQKQVDGIPLVLDEMALVLSELDYVVPSSLDEIIARSRVYDRFDTPPLGEVVLDIQNSLGAMEEALRQMPLTEKEEKVTNRVALCVQMLNNLKK